MGALIGHDDVVNPSTRIVRNAGNTPSIKESAFVAPNATVVGQVQLGEHSSIWYGATVRGKSM